MSASIESEDYAVLKIWIDVADSNGNHPVEDVDAWRELYRTHIEAHNEHVRSGLCHANSGFDVFFPNDVFVPSIESACSTMIPLNIKATMYTHFGQKKEDCPTAFYLMPRSSISKTPLMLANQMGLIDRGYRGTLIAAVRNLLPGNMTYAIEKHTRLFQLVHPCALPILVELVYAPEEMTARGSGGFGSTGK